MTLEQDELELQLRARLQAVVKGIFFSFAHTNPLIGSPFLMILAAAPVELLTLPRSWIRDVPAAHLPLPVAPLYCWINVVVPLPFFHVTVSVILPASCFDGVVTLDVPPAANPAGVQPEYVDLVVAFAPLIVVDADSFAQVTLGVSAVADVASGIASMLPAATPMTTARGLRLRLSYFPPRLDEQLPERYRVPARAQMGKEATVPGHGPSESAADFDERAPAGRAGHVFAA